MVLYGGSVLVVTQVVLSVLGHMGSFAGCLIAFGLTSIAGEGTFVAGIPYASSGLDGVVTQSVATLTALYFGAGNMAGLINSFTVAPVFAAYGLTGIGTMGVLVLGLATLALGLVVPSTARS